MDADEHEQERFRDPRGRVEAFAAFDVLVVCPRCGECAVSHPMGPPRTALVLCWSRRLVCPGCGYADAWEATGERGRHRGVVIGGNVDPHFRRPLWLQASCCGGNRLWAWNVEHLDVLERYISAQLRERGTFPVDGHTSMLEKLPTWMKTAKNREELLKAISRLRATIPPSG